MDISVSLPDSVRQFLEKQVDTGRYRSVGEYVAALIEADERRAAQNSSGEEELRRELAVGIEQLDRGEYVEYKSAEQLAEEIKADGRKWLQSQAGAEPR